MRVLRARIYERELAEQQAEIASERKAQVGTGERSEKVRTYNFPQGRVTDHRIKLTAHNLDGILGGDLREFTDALAAEEKRRGSRPGRRADERGRARQPSAKRSTPPSTRCGAAGVESPRLDAELLLAEATGLGPRDARGRSGGRGRRRRPRGASARWCAGGCAASRSPTSSAARASGRSSSRSTAAC